MVRSLKFTVSGILLMHSIALPLGFSLENIGVSEVLDGVDAAFIME